MAARAPGDRRPGPARAVRVRAFAKINRTLGITGVRADGYHELRTVFQSVALHDRLTFRSEPGPFRLECDEPGCPTDRTNLVWRAADRLWKASGRRGSPRDLRVRIEKRIPLQAGLGGGSSDAASALRALALLWNVDARTRARLPEVAAALGADVPFFLEGGTVLGLDRGDSLFPLPDAAPAQVVLVLPDFGVSTVEAYRGWDADRARPRRRPAVANDLEAPVVRRHPVIGRLTSALRAAGAQAAGMSGSGSAVFGLFADRRTAEEAAAQLVSRSRRVLVTRTLERATARALGSPARGR